MGIIFLNLQYSDILHILKLIGNEMNWIKTWLVIIVITYMINCVIEIVWIKNKLNRLLLDA